MSELTNVLPKVLIKQIEDRLKVLSPRELEEKDEIQLAMEERCGNAHKRLTKSINELKTCIIKSVNSVYRYCLRWPTAIRNYKAKIDAIELELDYIGKTYNILNERDGAQKKRINSLQYELAKILVQRDSIMKAFWKVKGIIELRLE